jgi:hypothetical protein
VATVTRGPNTNALHLVSYESKVFHRAMGYLPALMHGLSQAHRIAWKDEPSDALHASVSAMIA